MDVSMHNCDEYDEKAIVEDVRNMLDNVEHSRSSLIPLLQNIQGKYCLLAPEALELIARELGLHSCEVYGVATFYNQFRFHPPGKHQIKVCMGTACHVKGADIILENFERKLNIRAGQTTEDREFSVDKVACIGCCALAPAVIVDEKTHPYMSPSKVEGIFLGYEIEKEMQARKDKNQHE
jgi:NADH-quinone oxidoreductase subunit E